MTSTTATDAKIEALKSRLSHTPSLSSKSRRRDEEGTFYGSFVNNNFEVPDEVTPSSNSPPPPSVTAPAPTPPAFHSPMDTSRTSSTATRVATPRVALKTLPQPSTNASVNPVTSVASENKSQLTTSNKITGKQSLNTKLDASSTPQKFQPTSSSRSDSVNNMSTTSTSTSSLVVYPNTTIASANGGTTSASTIKAVKAKPKPVSVPSVEQNTSVTSSMAPDSTKEPKSGFGIDFDSLMSKYSAPASTKPAPKLPVMSATDISQPSPTTIVKNVSRFEERNKLLSPLHTPSKLSFPIAADKPKSSTAAEDDDEDLDDMLSKELEDMDAPVETNQAEKAVVAAVQPQIELPKPSIDFDEEEESRQEIDDEDLLAQSLVNTKKSSSDKKESFKIPKKETASSKKEDKRRVVEQVKSSDTKKKSKLSPPVEHTRERSSSPSSTRKRDRSSDSDAIPEEKKRKTESSSRHSNQTSSTLLNQDGTALKREADRLFNSHNPECLSYYIEAGLKFLDLGHYSSDKAINSFEQFKAYATQVITVTSKNFAGENIRLGILYVLHAYACKEVDRHSRDRMQKAKAHLKNAINQSSPNGNSTPNQISGTASVNSKDLAEFLDLQRNQVFFLDSLTRSAEFLEGLKSQSVIQKYMYKCTYTQLVNWVRDVLGKL